MSKLGIDISSYQKNVDYDKVVNNGIEFAILRVGYGVSYLPDTQKDKQFNNHYAGFKNKIPVGAYYYSYAKKIGDGRKEAQNCLKYLDGKSLDLPIFYDLEDKTMSNINEVAREFVNTIKEAGYHIGIYCNLDWAKHKVNLENFKDCSIWIAMYGANTGNIPSNKPSVNYDIWQYTSNGHVSGIDGRVDMNISDDIPTPTPEPTPTPDYSYTQFVKDIQIAEGQTGKWVDGIAGPRTLQLTPTISRYKNRKNPCVKPVQKYLYSIGYTEIGTADGIAGPKFETAVKHYQRDNGLKIIDGELTKKANTWKCLLNLL